MNGHDDATFGRAIELGQHDSGEIGGFGEFAGLDQAVLSGRRIDHEQRLGHGARPLLCDTSNFGKFVHQVGLGVQASGGVGHDNVGLDRGGMFDGVEDDR